MKQTPAPYPYVPPTSAFEEILKYIGEDPKREGLLETPARHLKALRELTEGYYQDPADILAKTFGETDGYDEMVVVKDIPFTSLCEHHVLPFTGTATVAYIPNQRVVGLSKISRLVQCYAKRLQVQERLTSQIQGTLQHELDCRGVAVVLKATHSCMALRGIKTPAEMVTSKLSGLFKEDAAARAEFMELAK